MRKSYNTAFKSKVALEAIKEQETIQQIALKYDVHPNQVSQWKKQLPDNLPATFERPNKKREEERRLEQERDQLLRTVGELTVVNEFLKKKHREYYGKDPE
ncbi:transposase [Marispirochaeta sp.]|uniref:transposase n=1 Tax=Marispirochaeta sp. TaxID=2038653 RepID=UPI0029C7708B|nr:transposase [Marispirochaeta sp.]